MFDKPLRKGDVILVAARVKYDAEANEDTVHLAIGYLSTAADREQIHALISRKWDAGDVVNRHGTGLDDYTVVATNEDGKMVWITSNADGHDQLVKSIELHQIKTPEDEILPAAPPPHEPLSSPAAVPLGGAHLPEPYLTPWPVQVVGDDGDDRHQMVDVSGR